MNELTKKIIAGALSGVLAAIVVDVHAWSKGEGSFDWGLALKRWVAGGVSGAAAAAGLSGVPL